MSNREEISIFLECTQCRRNLENSKNLWYDIEKRICKCCECNKNQDLISCRRQSCNLHKYIEDDYIIFKEEVTIKEDAPENKDDYSEESNTCYSCRGYLIDFIYLNAKVTKVTISGDMEAKAKLKIKFCPECFKKIINIIKIKWGEDKK